MHIFIYKQFTCVYLHEHRKSNWDEAAWGRGMKASLFTKLNCIEILLWHWQNLFLQNLSCEIKHVNVNNIDKHVDHHFHTWSENK